VHFEKFESLLDQVTHASTFSLCIIDLVTDIGVLCLEQVHDRQDLSVVGHKSLSNGLRACHESLQNLEGVGDDLRISSVQGSLDWDNKLRDDRQNLGTSSLEHIENTLDSKESVGVNLLTNALKEDRQVVMVIKLLDFDFPLDFELGAMLNADG